MIVRDKDGNIIRTGLSAAEQAGKRREKRRRAAARKQRKKNSKVIYTAFETNRSRH
jgi:hypothetical protein